MSPLSTLLLLLAMAGYQCGSAWAQPPVLYAIPGYESPVTAQPDDLLVLGGSRLSVNDRIVYSLASRWPTDDQSSGNLHPQTVPEQSSTAEGVGEILVSGDPAYALTVHLPASMRLGAAYRLWVVNPNNQWSNSIIINDPRPAWITPAFVYETQDPAALGRALRVVGRNLAVKSGAAVAMVRLRGPKQYILSVVDSDGPQGNYVAEAQLPERIVPGLYSVATSSDGATWTPLEDGRLEVRSDPPTQPQFVVSAPGFGACRPNDGADDTGCFARAIAAANAAGGGIVVVPAGTWDLATASLPPNQQANGMVLGPHVQLSGEGPNASLLVRHRVAGMRKPGVLLSLTGDNLVSGLSFRDDEKYATIEQVRAVVQLGVGRGDAVDNIVLTNDSFYHVGTAVIDSGVPIRHLFITRNGFGGYSNALLLTGGGALSANPFRIDDSVVRGNRFVPGSYLDIGKRSGTIATQLGASLRVDFSDNVADGTSTDSLQSDDDVHGWRAAFFWNLSNNNERLLIAQNTISCPGDKAGDGEAVSLDGNGGTYAFDAAATVVAAGPDWVQVHARLVQQQRGRPITSNYYEGHWALILDGPGVGQARKVVSYTEDRELGTVTFYVSPRWDVPPARELGRIQVGQLYWQTYIVANQITQADPPCRKSNLNKPAGGVISFWSSVADSAVEANHQAQTDGIQYLQLYSAHTASCPGCYGYASFATALEIRGNEVDGEYDWSSDCSWSGIRGYFLAQPTPEAPPPIVGFGNVIAHNVITHADGQRGGAIQLVHAGPAGPPPGTWRLVQSSAVFSNLISDVSGPPPRPACRQHQGARTAIRIEGPDNVHNTVLYGNQCTGVGAQLDDAGMHTARVCLRGRASSCECAEP